MQQLAIIVFALVLGGSSYALAKNLHLMGVSRAGKVPTITAPPTSNPTGGGAPFDFSTGAGSTLGVTFQ